MERPILFSIICIIAGIGLIFLLVAPKYQQFQDIRSEIEKKDQDFKTRKEYFNRAFQASEELNKYSDQLAKINSNFSDGPSVPSLFDFFQKISSENGLLLQDINFVGQFPLLKAAKEKRSLLRGIKGSIYESTIEMNVFGSYDSFKSYLSVLEKSSRLMEVKTVNFTSPISVEDADKNTLFSLEIRVYSY